MEVKSESEIAQSRDPTDRSLPGSSVHGIFQARVPQYKIESLKKITKHFVRKADSLGVSINYWLEITPYRAPDANPK